MEQTSPWLTTFVPLVSTVVVAVATVVLVWLTGRYVKLTRDLVRESQRSREPSVTLDFELPDHTLRMTVENNGGSPAVNIRVSVVQDVVWLFSNGISLFNTATPVKDGVSYLAPGRKLKYYIGYPNWHETDESEMRARFHIRYESESGRSFEHSVDYDFVQMRDVLFESFKDSNLAVAEAIRDAERSRQSQERSAGMSAFDAPKRKCPMCAEWIPGDAKKCSRCGERVKPAV